MDTPTKPSQEVLQGLHTLLCETFTAEIRAMSKGEKGNAALLTAAARFLKDNGIEAVAAPKSPIAGLLAELPFGDSDFPQCGEVLGNVAH